MILRPESLVNRGPIKVIRGVVQGFGDLLEPHLIFQDFPTRSGIGPQELRDVVLTWRDPSISGRRKVLDMSKAARPEQHPTYVKLHEASALEDFDLNFDPQMGGFRDMRDPIVGELVPPLVYAVENAVNVARHLAGVADGQPLGYANAINIFGSGKTDRLSDFVKNSQDATTGGFHHNPLAASLEVRPSLWNTDRALNALWNLEAEDPEILEWAWEYTLASVVQGADGVGFRESLVEGFEDPKSYSTATAVNILKRLGEVEWIEENRDGVLEFLKACWKEDRKGSGGFRREPHKGKPSLLYTNQVLSAAEVLGITVDDLLPNGAESRNKVIALYERGTKSRRRDAMVFGFGPGWTPNSHVMRDTMVTVKGLAEKNPDFDQLWKTIYGNANKVVAGIHQFHLTGY